MSNHGVMMNQTNMNQPIMIQPNALHQYTVTPKDLPLSCPMPNMFLWNSHPKVYLAIEPTGWVKCPYCGAEYTLGVSSVSSVSSG